MKRTLWAIAVLFLCWRTQAAEIAGTVRDYSDGRLLAGVSIRARDLGRETTSDVSGRYSLADLPLGKHVVVVSREDYHTFTFELDVAKADKTYRRNIELKPTQAGETAAEFMKDEPRYRLPEITILTTRATSDHPVTFTNVTRQDVDVRNYGQDFPVLLTEFPNINAYSDGGNGTGYSYLRMRGFGQNRVAVQINGTPLNDAGSHEVFWIDLPDFAEDVQDVQVQRGVGSSLYGPAAFGGTINVVTRTPGLDDRARIRAEGSYGTWRTRRAMISLESDRIQNRYGVGARLSRLESDGYRFGSWVRLWSYYLSGARFTPRHTSRAVFYGGPEETHLAYYGVSKEYLEGRVTGDQETDRRYNRLDYPGEMDHFFQPHYELHDDWELSEQFSLLNSLYLFRGDGYYDQWRTRRRLDQYFFDPALQQVAVPDTTLYPRNYYVRDETDMFVRDSVTGAYSIDRFDVLRRRNVGETDWGWIPRLNARHRYGTTVIGGELRLHQARHEGWVRWGSPLPAGTLPDQRYYDYRIRRQSFSGYVHNLITLTDRLRAMADVQVQSTQFNMKDDHLWNVTFDKTFSSLSPRAGLSFRLTEPDSKRSRPLGVVYANLSLAQREPTYRDIYDPQDYDGLPLHDTQEQYFRSKTEGYEYIGPSVEPERMTNLEVGTHWQWKRTRLGLNGYWMSIRDEIVPWGTQNDLGQYVSDNADKTLHQGVEIVAAYVPHKAVSLSGNLALTDHHFVEYKQWGADLSGNRIAFDPPYVGNLRADLTIHGFRGALVWQAVGKQFVDNIANDETAVPAYSLLHLDLAYRFTRVGDQLSAVELRVRVNNALDREYEAFGSLDDDGVTPLYFVGAPRAVYTTLAVEL